MKSIDVVNKIKQKIAKRDLGILGYIPFSLQYPTLSRYLPGIIKGIMYMITADSGVSKTQLTKDMFVVTPYKYLQANPTVKLTYKIIYFALEESEEEFRQSFIRRIIGERFFLYFGANEMKGDSNYKLTADDLQKAVDVCDEVDEILKNVVIIDDVYNPTGIYRKCQEYASKWGKYRKKKITVRGVEKIVKGEWVPNDPDLQVIVVVDHLNDFMGETEGATATFKGKTISKGEAMAKWVDRYAKKQLIKNWKWSVVNVVQQSAEVGKKQFTLKGSTVASKHVPTVSNIGNNKEIQRAHYVIIGLFSPDKYDIDEYNMHNIDKLGNYYRNISIMKNRIGISNADFDMYHNGAIMRFKELPDPKNAVKLEQVYNRARKIESTYLTRNKPKK